MDSKEQPENQDPDQIFCYQCGFTHKRSNNCLALKSMERDMKLVMVHQRLKQVKNEVDQQILNIKKCTKFLHLDQELKTWYDEQMESCEKVRKNIELQISALETQFGIEDYIEMIGIKE